MANENVLTITDSNFESEVVKSEQPVLIDFWAEWCGPCRMVSPIIDELATEYAGKIKVGKVNVDENRDLALKFRVMSIPTIIIFKDGNPVERLVGVRTRDEFSRLIDKNL